MTTPKPWYRCGERPTEFPDRQKLRKQATEIVIGQHKYTVPSCGPLLEYEIEQKLRQMEADLTRERMKSGVWQC